MACPIGSLHDPLAANRQIHLPNVDRMVAVVVRFAGASFPRYMISRWP